MHVHNETVRTTVDVKPQHRSALLALAARRGQKGFSALLADAIQEYLNGEAQREEGRQRNPVARRLSGPRGGARPALHNSAPAGELAVILTDVLIDCPAGAEPIRRIAAYAEADRLRTPAVSRFELLSGAGEGKRGNATQRLLAAIPVLPLDHEAASSAAEVSRELDRTGQAIGIGDSLIAGIALAHGLPLFTRNTRHFERVAGLKLIGGAP